MLDNGRVSTESSSTPSGPSAEPETAPEPVRLPPRRVAVVFLVAVLALALDVITKALVVADLEGRPPVVLFGGLIYLDVIRNSGAAFSMVTVLTWVLSLF